MTSLSTWAEKISKNTKNMGTRREPGKIIMKIGSSEDSIFDKTMKVKKAISVNSGLW